MVITAFRSKRKNYGEECISNGECSVGLKCLYSKCVCPSTYKWLTLINFLLSMIPYVIIFFVIVINTNEIISK